jgi:hypothetical protein
VFLSRERPTKNTTSVIYDAWDKTRPFVSRPLLTKKRKILIMTGEHGSWRSVEQFLPHSLAKAYYAKKHGYKFVMRFSNQLIPYYPHDLFAVSILFLRFYIPLPRFRSQVPRITGHRAKRLVLQGRNEQDDHDLGHDVCLPAVRVDHVHGLGCLDQCGVARNPARRLLGGCTSR